MTLLLFFLLLDALIAGYFFREGWIVRSNMRRKYQKWFLLLLAVMAGACYAYRHQPSLAVWIAGGPAALGILFVVGMGFVMATFKGPWR